MSGTESLPCLLVDDLSRAADYYRSVLGFRHTEILGEPPVAALARRAEGAVLLQLASAAAQPHTQRRFGPRAWDAVFYVADLDRVAADLQARGARVQVGSGLTHISDRTLEIRDDWGNILAFAATYATARAAAGRILRRMVPTRVGIGLRDRRLGRIERRHLDEFQAFYRQLPDHRDIFYMFFASGLLHWVVSAERHIPKDVNLVLLGSALPAEEEHFIRENLDRPLHNIRFGVDDNTAWEFLFATNRQNFGYLDIDCFVLQPKLFPEMAKIDDDVAVNAIWTYEAAPGVPIGCTHFLFINVAVIEELRGKGRYISPTNYDWEGSSLPFLHSRTYCRVPTGRQRRMLLELLPPDERGRPRPPGEAPFFDTLVAYQVIASASGYRTHRIRPLVHRTQATLGKDAAGGRTWQQDMSNELIHTGGVSYYWKVFHMPEFRALYLAAEHAILEQSVERLPKYYAERRHLLQTELDYLGLSPASTADELRHHLTADRGLSERAAQQILGTAYADQAQTT